MTKSIKDMHCWVVTEGIAGTENQCIGVAEALGVKPVIKRIQLREPWKTFSPYLGFENWWSFDPLQFAPWPDLIIAGGRKSIALSRYIRRITDRACYTVQIQDPRIPADNFDLVAVPEHDSLRGKNVIVTKASPNRINSERLNRESYKFKATFDVLPDPKVAVLIGGNSKTHSMNEDNVQNIIQTLKSLEAGLMITVSRRTPEKFRSILAEALNGPNVYFWDGQGENPYFAILGHADAIFVTNDSASMISEAATTGKPVYVLPLKGGSAKFDRFYNALYNADIIRDYRGQLEKWSYPPLNDAVMVAKAIEIGIKRKFSADNTAETI